MHKEEKVCQYNNLFSDCKERTRQRPVNWLNWDSRLDKMNKILTSWQTRSKNVIRSLRPFKNKTKSWRTISTISTMQLNTLLTTLNRLISIGPRLPNWKRRQLSYSRTLLKLIKILPRLKENKIKEEGVNNSRLAISLKVISSMVISPLSLGSILNQERVIVLSKKSSMW